MGVCMRVQGVRQGQAGEEEARQDEDEDADDAGWLGSGDGGGARERAGGEEEREIRRGASGGGRERDGATPLQRLQAGRSPRPQAWSAVRPPATLRGATGSVSAAPGKSPESGRSSARSQHKRRDRRLWHDAILLLWPCASAQRRRPALFGSVRYRTCIPWDDLGNLRLPIGSITHAGLKLESMSCLLSWSHRSDRLGYPINYGARAPQRPIAVHDTVKQHE